MRFKCRMVGAHDCNVVNHRASIFLKFALVQGCEVRK